MHFDAKNGNAFSAPLLAGQAEGWFRIKRRVAWSDADPAGIYTFISVLRYAEDAEVALFRSLHLLERLYPRLPRVYVSVQYKSPAYFDEEIEVAVAIARIGKSSIHFLFAIIRGNEICADGQYGVSLLDDNNRPQPISVEVRETLSRYTLETSQ